MHELTVAKALFDLALRAAERGGAERVLEVRVAVGELSLVNHEQLAFWFREFSRGTLLEGAELVIERVPGEVSCPSCGYRGPLSLVDDPAYHLLLPTLRCPRCGSVVKVVRGRDCLLKSLRILKHASQPEEGAEASRSGGPRRRPSARSPRRWGAGRGPGPRPP